jgi:thiamine-monophosphate kinase
VRERERIQRLSELFGVARDDGIELGIGDDAAILRAPGDLAIVWTVDAHVEHVHFERTWLSWEDCGYRSFMAAASDVSAMGASPWCALGALSLPPDVSDKDFESIADGQKLAAQAVSARIVGGNLSAGAIVTLTTSVLGLTPRAIRRQGAAVGDGLWICGEVGLAAAGLRALALGHSAESVERAVLAWRRPVPRVTAGLAMGRTAHAAIDVSDGLVCDVGHLAEASGVCVAIDLALLVAHGGDALARAAEAVGADPVDLALNGGEDYALVAASSAPIDGFSRIGDVREGMGVYVRDERGERRVEATGFDHFAPRG